MIGTHAHNFIMGDTRFGDSNNISGAIITSKQLNITSRNYQVSELFFV